MRKLWIIGLVALSSLLVAACGPTLAPAPTIPDHTCKVWYASAINSMVVSGHSIHNGRPFWVSIFEEGNQVAGQTTNSIPDPTWHPNRPNVYPYKFVMVYPFDYLQPGHLAVDPSAFVESPVGNTICHT